MSFVIALVIVFSIILFIGMIGEKEKEVKKNLTHAFIVCILAIVFLFAIGG